MFGRSESDPLNLDVYAVGIMLLKDGDWAKRMLQFSSAFERGTMSSVRLVWVKLLSLNWVESMLHHVCKDPELRLKMDDIRHFHYAW